MDILRDFGVQPILLAAQVVNFLILLLILKRFLYGPILKVLEARKQRIETSLKNAEEIEKKLLKTEEDRDKILAKAESEMQKMMDETKKQIELMKEEGKVQAEQIAAQVIKKGQETAKAEAEKIKQEMMGQMAALVAAGMEKVTGKVFDKRGHMEMVEQEVKNLS